MKQFNPKSARLALLLQVALLFSLPTFSQTLIQGRILDATTQQPLQGVTVTVSGESRGTPTNAKGEYSINARPGSKLVITSVGYEPMEISAEVANMIIQLTPSSMQLTSVVVTALGVKKELKKLGYSIREVKGEDLVKARDRSVVPKNITEQVSRPPWNHTASLRQDL